MRRLVWVALGAAAGIYAAHKVQATLHAYSPAGLSERAVSGASGLTAGVRAFADDVLAAMAEREAALREALGVGDADAGADAGADGAAALASRAPALTPAEAADLLERPAGTRHDRRDTQPRSRI